MLSRRPRRISLPVALALASLGLLTSCADRSDGSGAAAIAESAEADRLDGLELVPLAPDPGATTTTVPSAPAGPGPLDPDQHTGPWTRGDDADLDQLWNRCAAADGSACDDLFTRAPVGSDYERFGLTCGDRPGVVHCAELGSPDSSDG